jgi:hypothetical protein
MGILSHLRSHKESSADAAGNAGGCASAPAGRARPTLTLDTLPKRLATPLIENDPASPDTPTAEVMSRYSGTANPHQGTPFTGKIGSNDSQTYVTFGSVFALAGSAEDYKVASERMMASGDRGRKYLAHLQERPGHITVFATHAEADGDVNFLGNTYEKENAALVQHGQSLPYTFSLVRASREYGHVTMAGELLPPVSAAVHELAHASRHATDEAEHTRRQTVLGQPMPGFSTKEEFSVIQKIENPAAIQLGEGARDVYETAGRVKVDGFTSTHPVYAEDRKILDKLTPPMRKQTERLDKKNWSASDPTGKANTALVSERREAAIKLAKQLRAAQEARKAPAATGNS